VNLCFLSVLNYGAALEDDWVFFVDKQAATDIGKSFSVVCDG